MVLLHFSVSSCTGNKMCLLAPLILLPWRNARRKLLSCDGSGRGTEHGTMHVLTLSAKQQDAFCGGSQVLQLCPQLCEVLSCVLLGRATARSRYSLGTHPLCSEHPLTRASRGELCAPAGGEALHTVVSSALSRPAAHQPQLGQTLPC